jgi:hypothetical protein
MRAQISSIAILLASCTGQQSTSVAQDSVKAVSTDIDTVIHYEENYRDTSWTQYKLKYSFPSFPEKIYSGKLAVPDFKSVDYGKDTAFQSFLSARLKGVGINFGGHYTIVESSCGAMCVSFHLLDRISGKIFAFPSYGDGLWGYRYESGSNLLIGNSFLLNDQMTKYLDKWDIKPVFYRWTGTEFKRLP